MLETAVVNGAELFLNTEVTGIKDCGDHVSVETNVGAFEAKYVLSAAGVHAGDVRRLIEEPPYEIVPTRGQ